MKDMGVKNVKNMSGGYKEWLEKNNHLIRFLSIFNTRSHSIRSNSFLKFSIKL